MKKMMLVAVLLLAVCYLPGCAGCNRGISSMWATGMGADWIVVQYTMEGKPFNCWKLEGVSISNEAQSDGIYWKDTATGHLVHISGWYNRVQVSNSRYEEAAELLGVELDLIQNGKYAAPIETR
jgi:hypothetical protein